MNTNSFGLEVEVPEMPLLTFLQSLAQFDTLSKVLCDFLRLCVTPSVMYLTSEW
jgi:hypothetical protein